MFIRYIILGDFCIVNQAQYLIKYISRDEVLRANKRRRIKWDFGRWN